jgi:murein DD-endopeptidase MepM/ murein hydrolase activator NlpD
MNFENAHPVLPDLGEALVLDLTSANDKLASINIEDTDTFTNYIFSEMAKAGVKVAIGRYNEDRIIYKRSSLFENGRSIHLGIDLWAQAGTPVFAPLPAKVHSFQNNSSFGDYGPTIILEHEIEGETFYTLYGHLSPESIKNLEVGQAIRQGAKIATLGTTDINVGYPPHLHFQIIRDMQGRKGDFPGVCSHEEREEYLALCPDPNLLLRLETAYLFP